MEDFFLFYRPSNYSKRSSVPELHEHSNVKFYERQVVLHRSKRSFAEPQDQAWNKQWHLHKISSSQPNINVLPAWKKGFTGKGVTVAIVDDGLEKNNADLKANFNAAGSHDFIENDEDPSPISVDQHGTSASGCVGAVKNNICGVGAAYDAKISGLRIMKGNRGVSDSGEGAALSYKCKDVNDIFTCSWGPYDDGRRLEGPKSVAREAMRTCINSGRGGKGTIYVWACGNGRGSGDNINYDGYANHRYTIAIGAESDKFDIPYYSERGSPLMAVAPSSGGSRSITTTGLTSHSSCTSSFGGTSAASPIAAGGIANVVQANPALSWRDVQHAIAHTSVSNSRPGWQTNGAGLKHNHDYGFGLLDIGAMIDFVTSPKWETLPANVRLDSGKISPSTKSVAAKATQTLKYTVAPDAANNFKVEHVEVIVDATLQNRGEFVIDLISPSGAVSHLQERHTSDRSSHIDGWSYWSVVYWGEDPVGDWKVSFHNSGSKSGSVASVQLVIYGHKGGDKKS
eukprot:TRINITY_DN8293_c0_g2_i1.p1 TRINITY_DN8293_c0_g2~~TRINITY_DN8293_c0_g2_i1.p1  ORF type:complete len:557 (-),score=76.06 TRINITY_DN8293_c0_g2_i1:320-1855(-)